MDACLYRGESLAFKPTARVSLSVSTIPEVTVQFVIKVAQFLLRNRNKIGFPICSTCQEGKQERVAIMSKSYTLLLPRSIGG